MGAFLTCETLFAPAVINQIRCLKDINELVPHIESALEAQQAIIERLQRDLSKEKLCTSLTRVLHANKRTFAALKNAFGEWKGACAKGKNFVTMRGNYKSCEIAWYWPWKHPRRWRRRGRYVEWRISSEKMPIFVNVAENLAM